MNEPDAPDAPDAPGDAYDADRRRMLQAIAADFAATAHLTGRDRPSPAVEGAIAAVPRHRFVPPAGRSAAYDNRPLPIGHGQTISQPFIVALMTELLDLRPTDRVLEIGTGCGYQAAVLARLAGEVDSVEIVPELSAQAARTLAALGVRHVALHVGDGHAGWPAGAPYDAIIATAAPAVLPPAWTEQLAPGGRLIAPVGATSETQALRVLHKDAEGRLDRRDVLGVRFVPLTGRGG